MQVDETLGDVGFRQTRVEPHRLLGRLAGRGIGLGRGEDLVVGELNVAFGQSRAGRSVIAIGDECLQEEVATGSQSPPERRPR